MYRKPTPRQTVIRLTVVYSVMTLAVIAIASILILLILNYRYDGTTGTIERQGLIQFDSQPSGARVGVDGWMISGRTATKQTVDPGVREFTMELAGYNTWSKTINISPGALVWLDYARLIPENRPVQTIRTYDRLAHSLAAPNNQSILLQFAQSDSSFRLVDISRNTPNGRTLTLPEAIYTSPQDGETQKFTPVRWDKNGRYVLVRYEGTGSTEWLVVDTRNVNNSRNLTQTFDIPITTAFFSGTSGNILYVLSDTSIRKVDLQAETISRPLVPNVASFRLHENNELTYVSQPDSDNKQRTVGLYREGDPAPRVLRTITNPDAEVSIDVSKHYGQTYLAIAEASNLSVYRGNLDSTPLPQPIASRVFDESVVQATFNDTGNYLSIRTASELSSYSVERNQFAFTKVEDDVDTRQLSWLDEMYLWSINDGELRLREIDGANRSIIMPAQSGHMATLSRNGTYIYAIGTSQDGHPALQRVRLVL